ncbi:MAG: GTPase domain-containing protein [Candidatus Cloacimonetes bacterium]|nr:GTPase domain-containing protein [Candidatus Cloacimonadota bacterium]
MLPEKKAIRDICSSFRELDKYIIENFKDLSFDFNKLKQDLTTMEWWHQEIESEKKSIFIFGKMSSGKSTFINFMFDNEVFEFGLPTSVKVESRIIIRIEHTKAEPYCKIHLSKLLPDEIGNKFKNYLKADNELIIPLIKEENIKDFHDFIQKNEFDPCEYATSVNIYHKLKPHFKEFVLFDTPGLGTAFDDTDSEVYNSFLYHSLNIWCLDGSEPAMSDVVKQIADNQEHLKKIRPNRLIFLSTHYDILVGGHKIRDMREIKDCTKEEAKDHLKDLARNNVLDKVKGYELQDYLGFYFIDLKGNTDDSHKCIDEILDQVVSKFKSIEIDMLMEFNKAMKDFLTKIIRKLEKEIEFNENQKRKIEEEFKSKSDANREVYKKKISQKTELDNFLKGVEKDLDSKLALINGAESYENYDKYLRKLDAHIRNSESEWKVKLGTIEWTSVTGYDFSDYYIIKHKKKKIPGIDWLVPGQAIIIKNKLKSERKKLKKYLDDFSVLKNQLKEKVELCINDFNSNALNEMDIRKKNIEKSYEENFDKLDRDGAFYLKVKNTLREKYELSEKFTEILIHSIESEIVEWREPHKRMGKGEKLIKFLKLYRNIKYYEILKTREVDDE